MVAFKYKRKYLKTYMYVYVKCLHLYGMVRLVQIQKFNTSVH